MKLAERILSSLEEAVVPLQSKRSKNTKEADMLRKELGRLGTSSGIEIVQMEGHWNTSMGKFGGSLNYLEITNEEDDNSVIRVMVNGGNMNTTDKVFRNLLNSLKKMKSGEADYDDVLGELFLAAKKSAIKQ